MEDSKQGRLETPEDARRFVFGGNAILTLVSTRTGTRFTYKVQRSEDERMFFVKVLVGQQNESDYQYLGHFFAADGNYRHGRKSRIAEDAPSARAWTFFVRQLEVASFPEALEVWHEGRCCRCGRLLTVPESVRNGIGPECSGKVLKFEARRVVDLPTLV